MLSCFDIDRRSIDQEKPMWTHRLRLHRFFVDRPWHGYFADVPHGARKGFVPTPSSTDRANDIHRPAVGHRPVLDWQTAHT